MKFLLRIAVVLVVLGVAAGALFYRYPLWFNDELIRYHMWRSFVRSEYVEAGGYRLHYFESTPPDGSPGIPLVLVHGLGSRGEDWSPMIPTLAASGFHVYAPDLLGYGRSAKPKADYSIALEEGVLASFMDAVHVPRADVAGWSMGGWIAAKLALDHPEKVDRLVVYDSAGIAFPLHFARDAFVPKDSAALLRLMALLTPKPRPLPKFVLRATLRKAKSEGEVVQRAMDSMVSGRDLLDGRLSGIAQPTLIVWGMDDTLIPLSVGETMHREIRGSVFEGVSGCGHLAPGECPKPVLAGTIQFLRAQPPMRGGERVLSGATHGE